MNTPMKLLVAAWVASLILATAGMVLAAARQSARDVAHQILPKPQSAKGGQQ